MIFISKNDKQDEDNKFNNNNNPETPLIRFSNKFLEFIVNFHHLLMSSIYLRIQIGQHLVLVCDFLCKVLILIFYI